MRIEKLSVGRNMDGVSPVIATILLVAITVVLAATLYYMVIGFGGDTASNIPPVGDFTMDTMSDGMKFTFTQFSRDTVWGDISIIFSDGTNITTYNNITTAAMATGDPVVVQFGSHVVGPLTVFLNITDMVGNGYVNGGDFFTLTTSGGNFSNIVTYDVIIIHNPSDSRIVADTFQGS
jgi:flagellin-like protein